MQFESVLGGRRFILGEGPHFDRDTGRLAWVDIVAGEAWQLDSVTGAPQSWRFGQPISAVVPRTKGGLMVAIRNELVFFDPDTGTRTRYSAPELGIAGNRSNEARVDPTGRFWLGTMQNNIGPNNEDLPVTQRSGALYRIEADGRFERVVDGIGISNTLCWDGARKRLYYGDSKANTIWAFDWEPRSGAISNRRVFARPHERGVPDGSALDAEGHLWNCRWGGSCIIRYSPEGSIDRIIEVPVTQPTSCVFGGSDLQTLYVTSALVRLSPEQCQKNPLEGALLMARAEVAGQPCTRLAA